MHLPYHRKLEINLLNAVFVKRELFSTLQDRLNFMLLVKPERTSQSWPSYGLQKIKKYNFDLTFSTLKSKISATIKDCALKIASKQSSMQS